MIKLVLLRHGQSTWNVENRFTGWTDVDLARSGYDIVKDIDFPWPIADIVLQHHERHDGTGYPDGLRGDEISPEARVVAVADVLEAMVSHRPYRPGLPLETGLSELREHRGAAHPDFRVRRRRAAHALRRRRRYDDDVRV